MLWLWHVRYQVIYQIGVFVSRSSVSLIQIPQVFIFPVFQVCLCSSQLCLSLFASFVFNFNGQQNLFAVCAGFVRIISSESYQQLKSESTVHCSVRM